jgi:hypothetical protein
VGANATRIYIGGRSEQIKDGHDCQCHPPRPGHPERQPGVHRDPRARSNRIVDLQPLIPAILLAPSQVQPGRAMTVGV